MSEGSLSQDEIDALLAGTDSIDFSGSGSKTKSSLSDNDRNSFIEMLNDIVGTQASNLSMLMGRGITVAELRGAEQNREEFLANMPEELVEVKIDFTEGLQGDHLFIMSPEDAQKMAGLMMGQDQVDLNDVALSSLGEAISNMTGPAVTTLGDKTGSVIMTSPPEAQFAPKVMMKLPHENFVSITYSISIDGDGGAEIYEIVPVSVINNILQAAGKAAGGPSSGAISASALDAFNFGGAPAGGAPQQQMGFGQAPQQQMNMQQPMGGYGMPGQAQGYPPQGGMPQQGYYPPQGQMYQQPYGYPPQGMMPPQGGPNVQSLQFPPLQAGGGPQDQGNISLLMDVNMEMTVELGRTKKLIREILGMGEGTIIELDKLAGEPVDILVNHKLIAKGEVVVIDENFGVRVTEIVSPIERMAELS